MKHSPVGCRQAGEVGAAVQFLGQRPADRFGKTFLLGRRPFAQLLIHRIGNLDRHGLHVLPTVLSFARKANGKIRPAPPAGEMVPYSAVAESDSIQNGLILPRDPKNLELILRNVDAKGYLDIELVDRLRQREFLGSVKQKIVRKIQQNESAFCFEDLVRELLEAV